ncbi:acyl-CoA ligase (AMP-forming), exosortase A system-associated [Arsukibacterium indicum]|uniref:Acyl-CoA ligase (AMP-forming), exosortase A system-associated n=1 Tax=Arsukibacterium indicum TaxID=2848612 RepID=A0ABS6MG03_9GAMM|nr:acyl-CoA ligase (AMP-forming), exosortase A system-associated [Arsukibacterium indicum]MBV2127718.1 acyl-CoA ligase (AMP-forming), exosortase A system-associated [Arsukibacterium indicum]
MTKNLYQLLQQAQQTFPRHTALYFKEKSLNYTELLQQVDVVATTLQQQGIKRFDRVAVYLPKQFETIFSIWGANAVGGVFVPVNPALKAVQVQHILQDCNVRVLITSKDRLATLNEVLALCPDLHTILLTDDNEPGQALAHLTIKPLMSADHHSESQAASSLQGAVTDSDMAAILYTSGSTGKPKGVVLSQRNMLVGASSVATYLQNRAEDVILALLPLSFDYGLSQLTTAFSTGASVVLLDFFLVQDVVRAVARHKVTGIAAVPPLWAQLAKAKWPDDSAASVRYLTNSGGAMPQPLLQQLQSIFSNAEPYLMYGLTEAFRSTYLPPADLARKPGSMGKAIPNAEILVVREDGSLCGPNEPGELVHRGPLVSLGYWNAPEKTAERFKFDPVAPAGIQITSPAVWSGDTVKADEEGYLYFVGRRDEMIKTSGYRVSPTEVEEAIYRLDPALVDVAAMGVYDGVDQAILVVVATSGDEPDIASWQTQLKRSLPNFMQPKTILVLDKLPKNANGKIDRKTLANQYQDYFLTAATS